MTTRANASRRREIALGDLGATLQRLDAEGGRPVGLVMSPESWALLSNQPQAQEPVPGEGFYDGVPVWLQTDCDGVQLVAPRAPAPQEVAWI